MSVRRNRTWSITSKLIGVLAVLGMVVFGAAPSFANPPVPAVATITPNSGAAAGGGTVTVTGSGFSTATAVDFGTTPATNLVVASPTQLTVTVPAHAAGLVDVTVVTPLGSSPVVAVDHYTYQPVPAVTAVSPAAGSPVGGGTVTVTGSGFLGISGVSFGSTPGTNVVVKSSTTLTVTVPAEAGGVVDVTVSGTYGTSVTVSADQFTFAVAPTVSSVTAPIGVISGGGPVVIGGTGFFTISKVTFDGVAGTGLVVNSPTQITVNAPAHVAGTVDVVVVGAFGTSATNPADEYTYAAVPAVTSLTGSVVGALVGGGTLTINGSGFSGATSVLFGTTPATIVTPGATSLTVTVPAHAAGVVDVRVVLGDGTSAVVAADKYTYEPLPAVTAVSPAVGGVSGGTTVTVTGTGFIGVTGVTVGGTPASHFTTTSSTTSLTFVAPAGSPGVADVQVTTPYGLSPIVAGDHYTYQAAPTVTTVSPNVGVVGGGGSVTITGTGFVGLTSVTFGGTAGTSLAVSSPTQLTVKVPAHTAGPVDVQVFGIYGSGTSSNGYIYGATPLVTALSASSGVLAGGNTVIISGSGFMALDGTTPIVTGVLFGTTAATGLTVTSPTQLSVTVPAHAAGLVDVHVVLADGASPVSVADRYTYQPGPTVTAITPSAGTVGGGNVVTVTGTGFLSAGVLTTVMVGSNTATNVTVVSSTKITFTAPAGSLGVTDVQVATQYGTSPIVAADHYTYEPVPAITSVTPAVGVAAGANIVTVTGSGFISVTQVVFGSTASSKVVVVSSTQLTVTVPAHVAGLVDVQVVGAYGSSPISAADQYLYEPVPAVTAVSPSAGVLAGGGTVTITGSGFNSVTAVNFGTTAGANVVVNSSTQLTVTPPAHAAGLVDVRVVGTYGTSPVATADHYTYEPVPAVSAVTPTAGAAAGGTTITVTGSGFVGITGVNVGGTLVTAITVTSATSLHFVAPAESAGVVDVQVVGAYGTSPVVASDHYTYEPVPAISSVTPAAGAIAGTNVVTIVGSGFLSVSKVTFGGTASAKVTVVSATDLTVTAPAHAAGLVDVQVVGAYGTSAISVADQYTYEPVPTLTSISPAAGPLAGGGTLTITGSGFVNITKVSFGTALGTIVGTPTSTQITVTIPAHAAGTVDVQVVDPYGTSVVVTADHYNYQSTASVSGTVSGAGSPNVLLGGVEVAAYDASGAFAGSTYTNSSGAYTLSGLGTNVYRLEFTPGDTSYAPQWYSGQASEASATGVSVGAGQTVTGKSVVLTLSASISGNVTGDGSAPLENIGVTAYDAFGNYAGGATTDSSGDYSIGGLAAGSYSVEFSPEFGSDAFGTYALQWFTGSDGGAPVQAGAVAIVVAAGGTASGEDAVLEDGASISGTVTDSDTNAVSGVRVDAYTTSGTWIGSTTTDGSGDYTLGGLAAGSVDLKFTPASGAYAPQWFNDEATEGTADAISLNPGDIDSGFDVVLAAPAEIQGTVTGDDTPQDLVEVDAYDGSNNWVAGAVTDSNGDYAITGLAAGSYTLEFTPTTGSFATQWWDGELTQSESDTIVVNSGDDIQGEDAVLVDTGSISGNVFGAGTSPVTLTGVSVRAVDSAGETVESTSTDSFGHYTLSGLALGSYTLEFVPASGTYATEWWNGQSSEAAANFLSLTDSQGLAGENITLQTTGISGTVTGAGSATIPLGGISVYAVDAAGDGIGEATTNGSGSYTIAGLPAGSYALEFVDTTRAYATQWFTGQPTEATATFVTVAAGASITGKNAVLSPASGTISGTVTQDDGGSADPASFVEVLAFDSAGNFVASAYTQDDGTYVIGGLPAGSYKLLASDFTFGGALFADQWWTGVPATQKTATQATATISVLPVSGALTRNFELEPNSTISGTVTGFDTAGAGLGNVFVFAYNSAGDAVGYDFSSVTDDSGNYTIEGLPAGTYTLDFEPSTPDDWGGSTPLDGDSLQYAPQWYNGKSTEATATAITVSAFTNVVGKNVTLSAGAVIQGSVNYIPLDGVQVSAYDSDGNLISQTETDSSGDYELEGFAPGTYTVDIIPLADADSGLSWWYNSAGNIGTQLSVTVTAGQQVTEPTVSLVLSASISGTVSVSGSPDAPLSGVEVDAYDAAGELVGTTSTDDSGAYQIAIPKDGSYTLDFNANPDNSNNAAAYLPEWWGGQATEANATLIPITAGEPVTDEDIGLVLGATISGIVDGSGTPNVPLDESEIDLYNSSGVFQSYQLTDSNGDFTFAGLPAGSYTLLFVADVPYAQQWLGNTQSEATATLIPVTTGQSVTGENAVLAQGGSISGTVRGQGSSETPLSEWQASAYDANGNLLGESTTDASGNYAISALPAGTYSVGFTDLATGDSNPFAPQWYKGQSSESTATPITVAGGASVTGKNVVLVPGATISGTMYGSGVPSEPTEGHVDAYDVNGDVVATATASDDGIYVLAGLAPGKYWLNFVSDGFNDVPQWWKGKSTQASSTPITVLTGQVVNSRNVTFSSGATITGTVTDTAGHKLDGMFVPIWQLVGSTYVEDQNEWASTGPNGTYTLAGLAPGTYKVGFADYATGSSVDNTLFGPDYTVFGPNYWSNEPTLGSATPITLTNGQVLGGVNAVMTKISALAALTATPTPTITGTAKVGQVLTAVPGTWAPAVVVLTYQWQDDGIPITGATSSTYTPVAGDVGHRITVIVTGQKVSYLPSPETSAQTAAVTS